MVERNTGRKAAPIRKEKPAPNPSAPSTQKTAAQTGTQLKIDHRNGSHLEKGISELQGLHKLLLSSEVDPDVLADFRDALNRVRNTAWAAQQYIVRKENDQDSNNVRSLLVGERIRATYQLCLALADDLKRTDIEFQRGSLVQLQEVTTALTSQLNGITKWKRRARGRSSATH